MASPQHPLSRRVRLSVLEHSKRANVGHIGSALSVVDLLAALFGEVLSSRSTVDPDRDRFVLSKGHAALALYSMLEATGRLRDDDLAGFCVDGSAFATHPEHAVPGIDFSTGSLGQGLSFAIGAALAARIQGSARRAFVLLSDAECNEGSVWESITFAAHHRLGNVVALIDVNGQQALGYTREVLNMEPLSERWGAFGWDVHEVDGHEVETLAHTMRNLAGASEQPHVLLARTTFGKGVSYMENSIAWHYLPMSDEQYGVALAEVGAAP